MILLLLKLIKLKLEVLKSDFQCKKKDMSTDKLAINWKNFGRVQIPLQFTSIIRPYITMSVTIIFSAILKY